MRITVKFSSLFRILAGVDQEQVDIAEFSTIDQLAGILSEKYKELPFKNRQTYFMINGKTAGRDQVLVEGDQVRIFQMFAGG